MAEFELKISWSWVSSNYHETRGLVFKALLIRNLQIHIFGHILAANFQIKWEKSVIYFHLVKNYYAESFMQRSPMTPAQLKCFWAIPPWGPGEAILNFWSKICKS